MQGGFFVLALTFDSERQVALSRALHRRAKVLFCEDPAALCERVTAASPDAVVIELHDDQGVPVTPIIAALRAAFPLLPIVAISAFSHQATHDLFRAARAGLTDVILLGFDDPCKKLQEVVTSMPHSSPVDRILQEAEPLVPHAIKPMFGFCLESATEHVMVEDMARALGVSPKTLAVRCARTGAPTPRRLIGWGKLLMAAHLMEQQSVSVEKIAHALALESGAALRNLLRRYTGLRPSEVRAQGGLVCMVNAFARAFGKDVDDDGPRPSGGGPSTGAATHRGDRTTDSASGDGAAPPTKRATTERAS